MTTFIISFIMSSITGTAFSILGFYMGKAWEKSQWMKLKKVAMAGQTVWVQGIGDVLVLGYSDDESTIDYIPTEYLEGRDVHDIPYDELDSKTISVPVEQFLTHVAPDSVIQAARI